jgi:hypothetical protein
LFDPITTANGAKISVNPHSVPVTDMLQTTPAEKGMRLKTCKRRIIPNTRCEFTNILFAPSDVRDNNEYGPQLLLLPVQVVFHFS